jgi:hypothetical protein
MTFQPFRTAHASATMLATSLGSTRSSEMHTLLPYFAARASRSAGFFALARMHEYASHE